VPDFDDRRLTLPSQAETRRMQVSVAVAGVLSAPQADAETVTQALYGEVVRVAREDGAYSQVQMERDRYVGWVLTDTLSDTVLEPTHKVSALRTYLYSEASLKCATVFPLSLGARLTLSQQEGRYIKVERGGWIPEQHVEAIDHHETDPAGVAEQFLHAPYLWGGCDSLGLDCTGLTRAAFQACGVTLPRDSDMQFAWCGQPIERWKEQDALMRNDLVFWKGHVGIMLDNETLLHANAHHMSVAAEPLYGAIKRIAKIYGEPIGARRIDIVGERAATPDWLEAG